MSSSSSSAPCDPGPSGSLPDGTPCYTQENIDCLTALFEDAEVKYLDAMAKAFAAYQDYTAAQDALNQAISDQCPPESSSSSSSM